MNDIEIFQRFRTIQANKLFELIKSRRLLEKEKAEAVVHALMEISESVEKLYGEIIPNILNAPDSEIDELKDKFWDIREELRYIEYHIDEAKLTD